MQDRLKSPHQEKFAQCLAQGMSQASAYREAYNVGAETKEETIWQEASRIAAQPKVSARVTALQASAMRALEMNVERILRENAYLAFSDVRQLFDADGSIKPVERWPDSLAAAVASIEVHEIAATGDKPLVVVKKIKFWDKGAALEKLFKNFGMYAEDNRQKSAAVKEMLDEIAAIGRGLPWRGS